MLHPNALQTNNTMAHGKGVSLPYMTNVNPAGATVLCCPFPTPSTPHSLCSILSYAPPPTPAILAIPHSLCMACSYQQCFYPTGFFIIFIFASPKRASVPRKQGLGVNFRRPQSWDMPSACSHFHEPLSCTEKQQGVLPRNHGAQSSRPCRRRVLKP